MGGPMLPPLQVLLQMVVLVAAFVACWLPFWVFYVTLSFCLRRQVCLFQVTTW